MAYGPKISRLSRAAAAECPGRFPVVTGSGGGAASSRRWMLVLMMMMMLVLSSPNAGSCLLVHIYLLGILFEQLNLGKWREGHFLTWL